MSEGASPIVVLGPVVPTTEMPAHVTLPAQPIAGGSPRSAAAPAPVTVMQAYATFPRVTYRVQPTVSIGGA
jgi:hypothetical protein